MKIYKGQKLIKPSKVKVSKKSVHKDSATANQLTIPTLTIGNNAFDTTLTGGCVQFSTYTDLILGSGIFNNSVNTVLWTANVPDNLTIGDAASAAPSFDKNTIIKYNKQYASTDPKKGFTTPKWYNYTTQTIN
jgi:LysM repeat protein